jgi:hypothetical protein
LTIVSEAYSAPTVLNKQEPSKGRKAPTTYQSRKEAKQDREQQQSLLAALDASKASLLKDDCGAWCIFGKTGKVYTWGDHKTWVCYLACSSPRQWAATKKKLSFLAVTQDCDQEGCLRLFDLPTPEQAGLIREALGLRKAPKLSAAERERRRNLRSYVIQSIKEGGFSA